MHKKLSVLLSLLMMASLLLAACASPAPVETAAPEIIEKTVIQTQIVEVTPQPGAHPEAVIPNVEEGAEITLWTFWLSPTFDDYIKSTLEGSYSILYTGTNGRCAHEMIVDLREYKQRGGIVAEDVAKRLMDYGFHAPTMSFPVPGTIMIEPTESEDKAELDRFCDALLSIRQEIREIEEGRMDKKINPLKCAPHTQLMLLADEWNKPYSRQQAAFPMSYVMQNKFWPSVARVNNTYGDRNLVCTCEPIESYMEPTV